MEDTSFTDHLKRKAAAKKGKSAEDKVKDAGKKLVAKYLPQLDFERVRDARSAGGFGPAVTGDFVMHHDRRVAYIEVKETAVTGRLPVKNFGKDQRARMHRRMLTGVETAVLIHHTTEDIWVLAPMEHFIDPIPGGWPTDGYPYFRDVTNALLEVMKNMR